MVFHRRSPHGRTDVMYGPVIATEARLAFAGASVHSNNTAEMSDAHSFFFLFQACCWCLLGHNSCSHARTAWILLPTVIAVSPAQATIHHATCVRSRGESWKRMCRSCCCAGCLWLGFRTITFPRVECVTPLIPLHALLPATTLEI